MPIAVSRSRVQTPADRPNDVEFAMRAASWGVSKVSTLSTGPKISSRAIRMVGSTPAKTVGSMKRPFGVSRRPPPSRSSAPSARPASTRSRILPNCSSVAIAPTLVAGSSGSPTGTVLARSTTRAMNSSAIERWTRRRLPLLQHSPMLK